MDFLFYILCLCDFKIIYGEAETIKELYINTEDKFGSNEWKYFS